MFPIFIPLYTNSRSDGKGPGCFGLFVLLFIVAVVSFFIITFMDWRIEAGCEYCDHPYTGTYFQYLGETLRHIWKDIILKIF